MQDTLAQDWRKRMAARSTVCAMLLAIPVLTAVVVGFSAGPGGLPFGISALTSGPSPESQSFTIQPGATSLTAAAPSTPAPTAAPGGTPTVTSGGGSTASPNQDFVDTGGSGGDEVAGSDQGGGLVPLPPGGGAGGETGNGGQSPQPPGGGGSNPPIETPSVPEPATLIGQATDMAQDTINGLVPRNPRDGILGGN
jgi:hypothetical protein